MSNRPHGYARYRLDGCRCYVCGFAASEYERNRNKAKAAGTWMPFVDAQPVRDHLAVLSAAGIGYKRVASLAGVPVRTVSGLLFGHRRQRVVRIRPATAEAILAVQPTSANAARSALIPAVGTIRRIQAMCAIGWSLTVQAQRAGWTVQNYAVILRREQVMARTARMVADLYERLSMTPAPPGYSATRTRRWATAQRMLPPLTWDDEEIDDPDAQPRFGLLEGGEQADEALIWWALQGVIPASRLPSDHRAILRRHQREQRRQIPVTGTPRGMAAVVEAYLNARADGCTTINQAADRLGIKRGTLDVYLARARRAGDTRLGPAAQVLDAAA